MKWSTVIEAQDESQWFEEYVREALACEAPRLPAPVQRIGPTTATWFECRPGEAFIRTEGGTGDDKILAQTLVREQLRPYGLKQAGFTFEWAKDDPLRKEATWDDIEAKAMRLIQSGQVQINRNGAEQVAGTVTGDHGTYDVWFALQDAQHPDTITQWECGCPWDQYAWGRTRQWKKFEGRVCSHALALYWASKSLPKDEAAHPSTKGINPNQQSLFSYPGGTGPMAPTGPPMQMGQPSPYPQMALPGMPSPQGQPAPQPADVIPPLPMPVPDPAAMPNPVSVPGLKQPSPLNPVQYPGGTFSKVAEVQLGEPGKLELDPEWQPVIDIHDGEEIRRGTLEGFRRRLLKGNNWGEWHATIREHDPIYENPNPFTERFVGYGEPNTRTHIPLSGIDGYRLVKGKIPQEAHQLLGGHLELPSPIARVEAAWSGVTAAQPEGFVNGNMVTTRYEDWGEWVGRSEEHGAGERARIPAGSPGEVLGQDPTTGMVNVLFMNQATGVNEHGNFEPWGITGWFMPSELVQRPDIRQPGPAIQRRR